MSTWTGQEGKPGNRPTARMPDVGALFLMGPAQTLIASDRLPFRILSLPESMRPNLAPIPLLVAAVLPLSGAVQELRPKPGLAPLPYGPSEHPLPNYIAGEKWGTEGERITRMQKPLPPADSAARVVLRDGFRADLWAAEPDILKPISMTFDERGRLYIAETKDYPNELRPPGQGRDRIKVCEDTDGDGRADRFTVFAENLSIPTGLCAANGGLVVVEGGRTLFLRDADGDGRAEERRVLFSGWDMGDTHATASNIRYGHDNWIWGVVGYSGFDGEVGGRRHRFGMGVYRFRPDGSEMEFVRSSNNNTWGLGLAEDGQVFGSTANGNAAWYMSIPNRFYEAVSGGSAARMDSIADSQAYYPIAGNIRQVDWHGKYTAGAGSALYTARSFPSEYWGGVSFVCEPTGHLVGQFRITADGAGYRAANERNFLASDDEWFAPIMAEVGPDGALWVLDWYNYIIQHNPVPTGFQNGKGNAYETPLRDKTHGRIYRVTHAAGKPAPKVRLAGAGTESLVAALRSEVMDTRLHAQRLLVERKAKDAVPGLLALVADTTVDGLGLNPGALHALWTLDGLGEAAKVPASALSHPSAAVRRAAVQVLPLASGAAPILAANLLSDPDVQVRKAAFLALTERGGNDAGAALAEAFQETANLADRHLREALTVAAAFHNRVFLTYSMIQPLPAAEGAEVLRTVARHQAATSKLGLATLLAAAKATKEVSEPVVAGIAAGWPADAKPEISDADLGALKAAAATLSDAGRVSLVQLAIAWGRRDAFRPEILELAGRLRAAVADASAAEGARVDAARRLLSLDDGPEAIAAVLAPIGALSSPGLANGLIGALSVSRVPEAGIGLVGRWSDLSPAMRRAAAGTLLRRREWAVALLDAIAKGDIPVGDLSRDTWNQLRRHPESAVSARAAEVEKSGGPKSSAEMAAMIARILPEATREGDVARGRAVYEKNCSACHAFAGRGGRIGPDLTGIGARPKSEILPEILDPNRSVEANYRLWTVTKKDGESLGGRLDAETATTVEIVDTLGAKHVVLRKDVEKLESSGQSIMPGGFDQLPVSELADLLTYLAKGAAH